METIWQNHRMSIIAVVVAAIALFSKILPWFIQANVQWIALFLPIHAALAMVVQARSGSPPRVA